jgi:phosphoglucomutase
MEITGKIKSIGAEIEVGTSGFKKRDLIITTDEQYPQHILVQFVQDKCEYLDKLAVGENVVVGINLRGREWTNPQGELVYFNTIQGWKIN